MLTPRDLQEYSGEPLTVDERREFRRYLEQTRRTQWLRGSAYRLVIAVGAVAIALTAAKIFITDHLPKWGR